MKTVKEMIYEMMVENTGSHFLDSGGAYGRNHQRNAKLTIEDFQNSERVTFDVWTNEITETVNIFHYLQDVLDVNETSEALNRILDKARKESSAHWAEECMEVLKNDAEDRNVGLYENIRETFNTYNGENNVSQTLLFSTFTIEDTAYCLLQIHGGCDVRGGYTDAKVFELTGYLTGQVDVYGSINGVDVSNTHNGWSITTEEGSELELNEDQDNEISLDYSVMDETYIYFE